MSVVAVVDDMFFASKIRAVAEAVGVEISFPRTKESLIEKARQADLVIVDLQGQRFDPLSLPAELGAVRLLGFLSHVEVALQAKARAAGYDQVIPRSVFSRDLAQILSNQPSPVQSPHKSNEPQ
jgi:DNA-binding NarL/FixJ family response regulator